MANSKIQAVTVHFRFGRETNAIAVAVDEEHRSLGGLEFSGAEVATPRPTFERFFDGAT